MNWDEGLDNLLRLEVSLLFVLGTSIFFLEGSQAGYLKIYELFGALLAASITTFGINQMRQRTR